MIAICVILGLSVLSMVLAWLYFRKIKKIEISTWPTEEELRRRREHKAFMKYTEPKKNEKS